MSEYSQTVSTFLVGSLIPEIDSLNLKIASMEEFSYNSDTLNSMRLRVNRLVPVYDFLLEYVEGEEECDFTILTTLISLTGLGVLSNISSQPVIDTPLNDSQPMGLNEQDLAYMSILVNGSVFDGSPVKSTDEHTIIFSSSVDIDSIIVNGDSNPSSSYRIINAILAVGSHPYTVVLVKNGVSVFSKTITIESI